MAVHGNTRRTSVPPKRVKDSTNADYEDTSKSSKKPHFKIVRNNLGSLVILLFGLILDLYVLGINTYYTYKYGLLKPQTLVGAERNSLFVCFVAFVASIFSLLFTIAIISVSSLTMQKQKRLKIAPFIIFSVFKLILFLWMGKGWYIYFFGLLIKDLLLYSCMSHTAKNKIVRKFFKPFKQVVYCD